MQGIQIGGLLLEQGVLNRRQVEHILRVQKMSHRPFGDLAERLYGISPQAVEDAWVAQYLHVAGVVDLEQVEIDPELLPLISRRQAWQFHLLPLNRDSDGLNMATTARHLVRAVNFAARFVQEPIHLVIADRRQLWEFLMRHYPVPRFIAQFAERL